MVKDALARAVVLVACLVPPPELKAADDDDGGDGRARLATEILDRAEAAAGRPFDPRFRTQAHAALAALSGDDLRARAAQGGASLGPLALGDGGSQLVYTPVAPCRLIDTRAAGGSLAPAAVRDFRVTGTGLQVQGGNPAGCGVPFGRASSVVVNFVAVNPTGAGNLRAWAYSEPAAAPPTASIINYAFVAGAGLNLANAVVVPLCDLAQPGQTCPLDLKVQADVNGTHLVADVAGYFERFAKEEVRTFAVTARSSVSLTLSTSCTNQPGGWVSLTAPSPGRVTVRGTAIWTFDHLTSNPAFGQTFQFFVGASNADCSSSPGYSAYYKVPPEYPSTNQAIVTVPLEAVFDVAAGPATFYMNALKDSSVGTDRLLYSTLIATFHPN